MVNPVKPAAFILLWYLSVGFVTLADTTRPETPSCTLAEVLTGCSNTFTAFIFGTFPGAPAEINIIILWIDLIIAIYFLWTFIVLVRGGAAD